MTTVRTMGRRKITRELRADLARVYLAAYGDAALPESHLDAENFAESTLRRHARRSGFKLVVSVTDDVVSGYGYGFTGRRGQFWSDWLASTVPADIADTWVGDHFELVDMVVDPAFRGRGVAGQLHDHLVHGLPEERALLATLPGEGAAARLYEGRGWTVVAAEIDGSKALYGLDLRGRTS
jgi:ribosomal protein S18 acetylase RimI-like enzyme